LARYWDAQLSERMLGSTFAPILGFWRVGREVAFARGRANVTCAFRIRLVAASGRTLLATKEQEHKVYTLSGRCLKHTNRAMLIAGK